VHDRKSSFASPAGMYENVMEGQDEKDREGQETEMEEYREKGHWEKQEK
jgi:hypothetical protein